MLRFVFVDRDITFSRFKLTALGGIPCKYATYLRRYNRLATFSIAISSIGNFYSN